MTLPPGTQTVEQRPVPVNAIAFPPPQGIRAANPGPTTERSNVLGGAQANQTQFHQPVVQQFSTSVCSGGGSYPQLLCGNPILVTNLRTWHRTILV